MVEHLLVVRGQPPSLGPLRSLVGALCVGGRGPGLLDRVLAVLGSPGEVEASTLPHLTHLAHLLCLLVAHLPPGQEQVRARVTRSLARGVTAWLEAGKEKRGLGLALVSAVLERLGGEGAGVAAGERAGAGAPEGAVWGPGGGAGGAGGSQDSAGGMKGGGGNICGGGM